MDNDAKKKEYLELVQRSRVREFFGHLGIYVIINGLLLLLNLAIIASSNGPKTIWEFWVVWPIAGWGIGILGHAYSVFFAGNDEMRMRELEIELGIPSRRSDRY